VAPGERGLWQGASDRAIGWLTIAVGAVALASFASLVLFFVIGQPFGTISDFGNGAIGVLSGVVACALRRSVAKGLRNQVAAVGIAVLGAGITVVGSILVMSEATGFLLAGLVSSVGFGCIGVWLIALNWAIRSEERLSRWLPNLGIVAGAVMALGLSTLPGIVMRVDNVDTAPSWIWIGFLGWIGIYVIYPVWAIWLGRTLLLGLVDTAAEREGA
jgi:hypothetical protein